MCTSAPDGRMDGRSSVGRAGNVFGTCLGRVADASSRRIAGLGDYIEWKNVNLRIYLCKSYLEYIKVTLTYGISV